MRINTLYFVISHSWEESESISSRLSLLMLLTGEYWMCSYSKYSPPVPNPFLKGLIGWMVYSHCGCSWIYFTLPSSPSSSETKMIPFLKLFLPTDFSSDRLWTSSYSLLRSLFFRFFFCRSTLVVQAFWLSLILALDVLSDKCAVIFKSFVFDVVE